MKTKGLILFLLAIVISCVTSEAKLTIAFVCGDNHGLKRLGAQFRHALVEIYGEDKVKEFAFEHLYRKGNSHYAFFGNGSEMILTSVVSNDEDVMIKLKEAIDHLATKGDTLYIVGVDPYMKPGPIDLSDIMDYPRICKLFVGDIYKKDLKMIGVNIGFLFFTPEQVYGHESELNKILKLKQTGKNFDKKKDREYCNRIFDLLMKSDRELLSQPFPTDSVDIPVE